MSHNKEIIRIKNLYQLYYYKKYSTATLALRGLDLTINVGDLSAIIGPNGSGKTTLLRIIAGFERATAADKLVVCNENLIRTSNDDMLRHRRKNIGFVDQFPYNNLHPTLTVEKNVMLPLLIKNNFSWLQARTMARKLLKDWNLTYLKNQSTRTISNGEALRVSLLMAIITNPPLLLADEPTGQLDDKNTNFLINMMMEIMKERDMTTVIVTHDFRLMEKMKKCFIIKNGKIVSLSEETSIKFNQLKKGL